MDRLSGTKTLPSTTSATPSKPRVCEASPCGKRYASSLGQEARISEAMIPGRSALAARLLDHESRCCAVAMLFMATSTRCLPHLLSDKRIPKVTHGSSRRGHYSAGTNASACLMQKGTRLSASIHNKRRIEPLKFTHFDNKPTRRFSII